MSTVEPITEGEIEAGSYAARLKNTALKSLRESVNWGVSILFYFPAVLAVVLLFLLGKRSLHYLEQRGFASTRE